MCYSAKGLITVSGFCKPSDADADDIELWLPVANTSSERTMSVDAAKYVVSLLSDCFTQLGDDENKASALDTRHGIHADAINVSFCKLYIMNAFQRGLHYIASVLRGMIHCRTRRNVLVSWP